MLRPLPALAPALLLLAGCSAFSTCPSARAVKSRPPEGFVDVEGGRVWYQVTGTGDRTPILVLHGGPGIPHDYLEELAGLGDERPVVFYDQLGCGRSERPEDPALWTRERFARELDTVRRELGLESVILYGHSWGTILAVDYLSGAAGERPDGVRGAVLAGPALCIPCWVEDARALIATLPQAERDAIDEGERTGATDSDAYRQAMQAFYARYVCRLDPWPDSVQRALATMGAPVYEQMNGPSEFTVTGTLREVDLRPELAKLHLPLLFLCGEFDEAPPARTRSYAALAPEGEAVVIAGAAHCTDADRPVETLAAVRGWLREHDL